MLICFFFDNHDVYEIMWKSMVEPDRPQMKTWLMRIACWIPKATNTHSEYVILTAFPMERWLDEHASMLRCMYIACCIHKATNTLSGYVTHYFSPVTMVARTCLCVTLYVTHFSPGIVCLQKQIHGYYEYFLH